MVVRASQNLVPNTPDPVTPQKDGMVRSSSFANITCQYDNLTFPVPPGTSFHHRGMVLIHQTNTRCIGDAYLFADIAPGSLRVEAWATIPGFAPSAQHPTPNASFPDVIR